jgi:hypothetical protein
LAAIPPVLMDLQEGRCFYCHSPLERRRIHVDHFIAWARYPVDLGHNFVLADERCNIQKRDRLPAYEHLSAWAERNRRFSDQIGEALSQRGVISELAASNRVAYWAYSKLRPRAG